MSVNGVNTETQTPLSPQTITTIARLLARRIARESLVSRLGIALALLKSLLDECPEARAEILLTALDARRSANLRLVENLK
jgi:hypothetical protein